MYANQSMFPLTINCSSINRIGSHKKMDNPLILQLFQKLHYLSCAHKTIHLCWIPSHIGIRGNEAAKDSPDRDITVSQVTYTDLKSHINRFISSKWQERWSSCRDNKLFQIKTTLGEWPPGFRKSRKEEVVLSRLRIGHSYFPTHIFYVGKTLLNAKHAMRSTLSETF